MNPLNWSVVVLGCVSLSALKINCQSDWDGGWFPYDPNQGPDDSAPVVEPNTNCDNGAGGPGCPQTAVKKDDWNGKWFPGKPDSYERVPMGIPYNKCDDGENNLDVDYDGNAMNYTCFDDKSLFLPNSSVHPLHEKDEVPKSYVPRHACLNKILTYHSKFPTFGPHRPLWPKYGEYSFVPIQRWLHTLEHGGIVMLYHPCANKNQVKYLKSIVRKCLFRHLISANSDLTPERPLALLAWGHRLFMSKVDDKVVMSFIRKYAGKGPEGVTRDGFYKLLLTKPARMVSGLEDDIFCPSQPM